MTSRRQKHCFYHFCLGNVCLDIFFKFFFMNAMPIPVKTKVHFKNLQFLAVAYDMGFKDLLLTLSKQWCVFPMFKQFLETEMTWSQPIIV